MEIRNYVFNDFAKHKEDFQNGQPIPHIVIDNFLEESLAEKILSEFPNINDKIWYEYNNAIENKKTYNHWESFPEHTYQLFSYLNSPEYVHTLEQLFDNLTLYADIGLNGGGWHIHGPGGKLNVHLDYSIHSKLKLERRLNIIIYLNKNWNDEWGGDLGFYSHDKINNVPKALVKAIMPSFNRAIVFDTTCNSWHGLPAPIRCPAAVTRKSLAIYYLSEPRRLADARKKALFSPYKEQQNNEEILKLIRKRSDINTAKKTYKTDTNE